ncbi:MAG: RraA family protein [Tatlockia sp.]|jgi:regulator of RNase E activity RraA
MNPFKQLEKLSSTHLSDALDACKIEGVLPGIKALTSGTKLIGPAYTIEYTLYEQKPKEFKPAANYLDEVPAHSVILIDNKGRTDCTTWGGLLTAAALKKQIAGTVVHGAVRDIDAIRDTHYPLFCTDYTMRSGKNRVYKSGEQCPLTIHGVVIHPGDIVFGDEAGVLVIPLPLLEEVIQKANNIAMTEEKILAMVQQGSPLSLAREKYRYDKPWLNAQ